MDFDRICLMCMRQKENSYGPCEHCGFDDELFSNGPDALDLGTILNGRYLIRWLEVKDELTHSFAYRGYDIRENHEVVIAEFYDPRVMGRQPDGLNIGFLDQMEQLFRQERQGWVGAMQNLQFLSELPAQSAMHHYPSQLYFKRTDLFKENHTYYAVFVSQISGTLFEQQSGKALVNGASYSAETDDGGKKVQAASDGKKSEESENASNEDTSKGKAVVRKRNKTRRLIIAGCIAAALIIAGVIITLVVLSRKEKEEENTGQNIVVTDPSEGTDADEREAAEDVPVTTSAAPETVRQEETTVITTESPAIVTTEGRVTTTSPAGEDDSPSFAPLNKNYDKGSTVMIYMIGSNLESDHAEASNDLVEIINAEVDCSTNNILIMTGGAYHWDLDIPSDENTIWILNDDGLDKVKSYSRMNMGVPDTLSKFINYCTDNYPSDHYDLIFWDHGGGPVFGFGVDELYGQDGLNHDELRSAMDNTIFKSQKMDMVIFNACIMASVEEAELWSHYADYMLADAEVEYSWDFSFLNVLNRTSDPVELAREIGNTYSALFDGSYSPASTPIDLVCMDLRYAPEMISRLDDLAGDLNRGIKDGHMHDIARARAQSWEYGYITVGEKENAYDLIDTGTWCSGLSDIYPKSSEAFKNAVEHSIVYSEGVAEGMTGVSLYFPYHCRELYNICSTYDWMEMINPSDQYRQFVEKFSNEHMNGKSSLDWEMKPKTSGGKISLTLRDGQAEEAAAAYATILEDYGDGTYGASVQMYPLRLGSDGEIVMEDIPPVYFLINDNDTEGAVIPSICLQKSAEMEYYKTEEITPSGIIASYLNLDEFPIHATFTRDREENKLEMLDYSANLDDGSNPVNTRNQVSAAGWNSIGYTIRKIKPETDKDGNLKSAGEWSDIGEGEKRTMKIDYTNLPKPRAQKISGSGRHYVCQIIVEDIYGVLHGSNLVDVT